MNLTVEVIDETINVSVSVTEMKVPVYLVNEIGGNLEEISVANVSNDTTPEPTDKLFLWRAEKGWFYRQFGNFLHNLFGGRDVADCHPAKAITFDVDPVPDLTAVAKGNNLQQVTSKVAGLQILSEMFTTSIINQEIYHKKVAETERVVISIPTFSGTIIYVSADGDNTNDGLTVESAKRTIGGAISAVPNEGVIQITDGTYDLVDESLGYLFVNTTKMFQIRGNPSDRSLVKITSTSEEYHVIRMYVSGGILWRDLTIETAKDLPLIRSDLDKSIYSVWCENVHFNFTSGGTGMKFFRAINGNVLGLESRDFVFKNCLFTSNYTMSLSVLDFVNTGLNVRVLVLNSEFESVAIPFLQNSCKAKFYLYDSKFILKNNVVAVRFGEDTAKPKYVIGMVDCRNNTITYNSGYGQHGILIGRGTADVYCVNNKILMDNIDNAGLIGIVIKSTPEELGESYIAGNYITSRRGIYIKGGQNNIIEQNYVNCYNDGFCLETEDPVHEITIQSTNNIIRENIFVGKYGINLKSFSSKASMLTGIINSNRYYLGESKIYLFNTTTLWDDKSFFWNFDNFSILLSYTNLPINTNQFV